MVEINHREHFIRAKILYYGPAAGGKTTNLQALHRRALKEKRLELVSVNTAQDRTILFDLLPLTTPAFRSYDLRFQIIAVPGQRLYAATRRMLLKNADSVVFVANSASDRWDENLQSMKEMTEHLLSHGVDPSSLPVIFQYNKRDLPNTTDVEMMERGLNARNSDSFPAIAIREQGVLETFAAALRRTMTELSTRYNIGDSLSTPRSALEWTERTMRQTFGVTGVAEKRKELRELEPRPTPRTPFRPPTVVRVKTPSQPRTSLASNPVPAPAEPPPPAPMQGSDAPSTGKDAKPIPSAAAELHDSKATVSLIESYAEAASGLGDHITQLREEKDETTRWLEEMSAVADMTRDLLSTGSTTDTPLKTLVSRLAQTMRTATASLSILRPDGILEPVIRLGLEEDHTLAGEPKELQQRVRSLFRSDKPIVHKKGESGVLEPVIDRAGEDCVAVVVVPLKTAQKSVGLLSFFLPQEASLPNSIFLDYLDKAALQIATALDAASNTLASDRLERSLKEAFAGRVARHAVRWLDEPLAKIESAASRLRASAQPSSPSWFGEGLLQIENNILKLKSMRQSVVGLGVGLLPPKSPTSLPDLLREIESELKEHLNQAGIRLQVETKPGLVPVRAEPFLLWSIISHLVEDARRSLTGVPQKGVIQILAQKGEKTVRLAVFDNAVAISFESTPSRYLAWPLDRRLRQIESGLVQPVLEYLQAQLFVETRAGVGTIRTLLLPIA